MLHLPDQAGSTGRLKKGLHSAELGERKSFSFSPQLSFGEWETGQKRCKKLMQGYCFQMLLVSHSSAMKPAFPDLFRKMSIRRKPCTGTQKVTYNQRGLGIQLCLKEQPT